MLSSAVRGFKALGRICSTKNNNLLNRTILSSLTLNTRQLSDTKKSDPLLKYDDDEIDDGDDDHGPDYDIEGDDDVPDTDPLPHISNSEPVTPPIKPAVKPPTQSVERRNNSEDNKRRDNTRKGKGSVFNNNDRDQWYQSNKHRLDKQKQGIAEREGSLRKRKVAIWFGYIGTGYKGSQKNPTVDTIEGELESALYKAGLVKEANFGDLRKMRWSRSSRTDRGVHAVKAIVGCKIESNFKRVKLQGDHNYVYQDKEQCLALPGIINKHLPPHIRVLSVRPVKKAFNARGMCNRRYYDYLIPKSFLQGTLYNENMKEFKEVLRLFEGMYNWHNFTSLTRVLTERKQLQHARIVELIENEDKPQLLPFPLALSREEQAENFQPTHSLFRLVETVDCDEIKIQGVDYVRIKVIGQSFVTHQIRKMVALILLAAHRVVPKDIVSIIIRGPLAFKVPLAPPEGLILRDCDFYNFSRKEAIRVFDLDPIEKREIDKFRDSLLLPHIHNELTQKKSFDDFLAAIPTFEINDIDEVRRVYNEWHVGGEAVRQSKKIRRAAVAMLRSVFRVLQDEKEAKEHYSFK